jgi:hypothetical protein
MSTEYFEINSAYRNRKVWPNPANFTIEISQSGVANRLEAADPVCDSSILISWSPFVIPVTGNVAPFPPVPFIGSVTAGNVVVIRSAANFLGSDIENYGTGLVIEFTNAAPAYFKRARIISWRFLCTIAGQDYIEITLDQNVDVPNLCSFIIRDPTDLSDPNRPLMFIPTGAKAVNFYINYYIENQTLNQWLPIQYYEGESTHIAILDSTLPLKPDQTKNYTPGTWTINHTYLLRQEIPTIRGSIVNVISSTQIQLAANSSTIDDFYVGSFIRSTITPNPNSSRIVRYDGATRIATLENPYVIAIGNPYEILSFSRDNEYPFQFSGSLVALREAICYDVQLLNLVLPNNYLKVGYGSRAIFYPYLYVELTAVSNSERQGPNSICSNNPNARRMLFRVLINDSTNLTTSPFIRLDGGGMIQRIKLLPADSFHFSVHLPSGEIFTTISSFGYINDANVFYSAADEWLSPLYPNPFNQISALFSFKRIDQGSR